MNRDSVPVGFQLISFAFLVSFRSLVSSFSRCSPVRLWGFFLVTGIRLEFAVFTGKTPFLVFFVVVTSYTGLMHVVLLSLLK